MHSTTIREFTFQHNGDFSGNVQVTLGVESLRRGLADVEHATSSWPEWKKRAAAEDFAIGAPPPSQELLKP